MSKNRVVFEVSDEGLKELDSLVEKCGFKTRVGLIEEALEILDWIATEVSLGRKIYSMAPDSGDKAELVSTAFSALRKGKKS